MSYSRRIPILAILLLLVLRLSIGWQFLYEGLWKYNTLSSSKPWTAEGYLKAAQGPYRDHFRDMTGDPDDLKWLDYDAVTGRWDAWRDRFVAHYQLDEEQQKKLDELLNGKPEFTADLKLMPPGVEIDDKNTKSDDNLKKVVRYDAKSKQLIVDGKTHLTPRERSQLKAKAKVIPVKKGEEISKEDKRTNDLVNRYHRAVDDVFKRASKLSYKEKLAASIKGDPTRAGVIREKQKGTVDYKYMGEIDKYRLYLESYEEDLKKADQDFRYVHLAHTKKNEISPLRSELIGPVKALDDEFKLHARKLLTVVQLERGPLKPEQTEMHKVNMMTIWALLVLGCLLISGLGTRLAAIAGAGMLMSFYLVIPPWPGVPQPPSPEHSLFINKNSIEAVALLVIACFPTGRWFGLDSFVAAIFGRRKKK